MTDFIVVAIAALIGYFAGWHFGYDNGFVDGFKEHEVFEEDEYFRDTI